MQVEGLRPGLVAAVADYRLKVELHSTSTEIAVEEKALLFQEITQRSRRGMRYDGSNDTSLDCLDAAAVDEFKTDDVAVSTSATPEVLSPRLRTRHRPSRYSHSLSISIR
jgi:hypothetical protein